MPRLSVRLAKGLWISAPLRRKGDAGGGGCLGCLGLVGLLFVGAGIWAYFSKDPELNKDPSTKWWAIGIGVVLLLIVAKLAPAVNCEVCGNPLRAKRYHVRIDGKRKTICPNCNRRVESRRSREARL